MLQVSLLGPLVVTSAAGDDLTPSGPRERVTLALLALSAPQTVSTERLADELYGDDVPDDPRNAVQAVVSRLRKALGRAAGALETHQGGYRLVDVELDIDQAETLLGEARLAGGERRLQLIDEALSLWQGAPLEGLSADRLDAERLRIDELRAGAEDELLDHRFELGGDDVSLLVDLEAAAADRPTREHRWALLMRTLYRSGRQADALRAFQRARGLLGERLGLEPGAELVSLEQQILQHDPALDAPAGEPATTPAATASPEHALPSGTVTVLLCDVEGSVRRWEASPDATAEQIAALHETWTTAVDGVGGHVVKSTGDGVMAVFDNAADAVLAAVAGQREHERSGDLAVRVAVNSGPARPVDGDYRGPLVNRCSRLLDLAAGRQILITGTTAALAGDSLEDPVTIRSLGAHWLRDVPDSVEIAQVHAPGIASEFPDLVSRGPRDLPRLRADMLGRDGLRSEVTDLVGEHPLVTLLGPGGIGKTTLSLAVAWQVVANRHVVFVDLVSVRDAAAVAGRIADEVAPGDDDRSPVERLTDRLRAHTDLVVLDNAEHVLDAVADTVDEVLRHELKGGFLVTSRHPLALPDEHAVAVPPLPLPADDADLQTTADTPAVALFVDRLHRARPDASLSSGLLPVVAHICRRLDGIPLAIELAAGRASVLAIEDIAARLDDQLRLLRQVPATRERRHRSLEAVVSWSLEQLPPDTRRLFQMLSAFAGDFGVTGVESTMQHFGLDPLDAVDGLSELASASLVAVERGSRFRLLEPVRQVAAAELAATDRTRDAHWAHGRWIADLLGEAFEQDGPERGRCIEAASCEADEIRAALSRVTEHGFDDLVRDLAVPGGYWFVSRDPVRGAGLWRAVVEGCRDGDPLTHALAMLGWCVTTASHPSEPTPEIDAALETLDAHDHPTAGLARVVAAFAHLQNGDVATGMERLGEADTRIPSDDVWARAILDMSLVSTSQLAVMMHQEPPLSRDEIERLAERAVQQFRYFDDRWALGITLGELGRLRQHRGDLVGAEQALLESIELFDETEFHGLHYILSELGRLASRRGDHEAAGSYHRQALDLAEQDGGQACMAVTFAAMAESAELRGDRDLAIELYEDALRMEPNQVKPGVPLAWHDDLARLRAET